MNMNIRPMTDAERKYTYSQSTQLIGQTGCIGHLRGDFGHGDEFYTSWDDHRASLKTEEFKAEFDDVINGLRSDEHGGMLASRGKMSAYCHQHPDSGFDGGYTTVYGFRMDTENYSYLFRLNPTKGDYNFYCYAYKRDSLDRHMAAAENGIRFITPDYKEKFRIADGDSVRINLRGGEQRNRVCRYIDDYHMELGGGYSDSLYHICEFAERLEESGGSVIPLRRSLPDQCYSMLRSTGEVVILKKGESGYYRTDIPFTDRETSRQMVKEYNAKLGVTPAQAAAMEAGSMFGWEVPAADPKNYSNAGAPLPTRGNMYDAMSQGYDSMEIFGQKVLFSGGRIDRKTVPEGLYVYDIRHGDEDWGEPVQLGKSILVNHYGTIISDKPIELPEDGLRDITEDDWSFLDDGVSSLAQYMKADQPADKSPKAKNSDAR